MSLKNRTIASGSFDTMVLSLFLSLAIGACGSSTKKPADDVGDDVADLMDAVEETSGDIEEDKQIEPDGVEVDQVTPACTTDDQCKDLVAEGELCKAGKCQDGTCVVVDANEGGTCDDGDLCTTDDKCTAGVCAGSEVVCNKPPVGVCKDATTVAGYKEAGTCNGETGLCEYEETTTTCPNWCVDGICVDSLGLLQAAFTPAGSVELKGAAWTMSCVMPGWAGGEGAASSEYSMQGGFEP